jgi:hypothetical protein
MKKLLLPFCLVTACTAPTVPGVVAVSYLVDALTSTDVDKDLDKPCSCLDPDEPTLVAIHCKEVNGKMVEASPTDSTHMCCVACMRKLGPAPKK